MMYHIDYNRSRYFFYAALSLILLVVCIILIQTGLLTFTSTLKAIAFIGIFVLIFFAAIYYLFTMKSFMIITPHELTIKSNWFPELNFPYNEIVQVYSSVEYKRTRTFPYNKEKKEYIHIVVTNEQTVEKQLSFQKRLRLAKDYRVEKNTYKFFIEMVRNDVDEILDYIALYIPDRVRKYEV